MALLLHQWCKAIQQKRHSKMHSSYSELRSNRAALQASARPEAAACSTIVLVLPSVSRRIIASTSVEAMQRPTPWSWAAIRRFTRTEDICPVIMYLDPGRLLFIWPVWPTMRPCMHVFFARSHQGELWGVFYLIDMQGCVRLLKSMGAQEGTPCSATPRPSSSSLAELLRDMDGASCRCLDALCTSASVLSDTRSTAAVSDRARPTLASVEHPN